MTKRQMRLTPELVACVSREIADPGPMPGQIEPSDEQIIAARRAIMREARDAVWFLAFGSLMWKPACDVVERRVAVAHGWHRAFCLGWDTRYRGNEDAPGLMLSLDRGGQCKGVAFRLPADALELNLDRLIRREPPFPLRWLNLRTEEGAIRAFAFAIDCKNPRYIGGLSPEAVAEVLAKAVGMWGSMAEYLRNTVEHLEELGILTSGFGDCRSWWRSESSWQWHPRSPRSAVFPTGSLGCAARGGHGNKLVSWAPKH